MNNFIKIRGKLFNMDMFIYIEELQEILNKKKASQ